VAQLSPACKTALGEKLLTPPPKAQPGFAALGSLGILPSAGPSLTYGGWITPRADPGMAEQHRLTVQAPIYRADRDTCSLSAGAASLSFGAGPSLSGSGIEVPRQLWKAEAGGSCVHRIDGEKVSGGRISVGSASDHPFAGLGVTTVGASAFYSWPTSERSRWLASAFFSNNNPIANYVPIPGFVYIYQTETFMGMFGFPFSSVTWMPSRAWMLTLGVFGPTVNAEAAYGSPRTAQLFAGFGWLQQSYLRKDRGEEKDRLYYDEKHVPVGVRIPLAQGLKTEFSFGYAFDRSVYEGRRFGDKSNGSVSWGAAWFGAWNLQVVL
jgi:hypothetical protein